MRRSPAIAETNGQTAGGWWPELTSKWPPVDWRDHMHCCQALWHGSILAGPGGTGTPRWQPWAGESARHLYLLLGADYRRTRPEADARALSIAGRSGGCWLAMVTAALDEWTRAAVLSGYCTPFVPTSWVGPRLCHHPKGRGLLCEMPDIARLIAPRLVFAEWDQEDVARPAHPAFEMTPAIHEAAGARARLRRSEFDGPRQFCGEQSLPWLRHALPNG